MAQQQTPASPFDGSHIPQVLKASPRWAPWRAIWNEKRQKFDKVPYRADSPSAGLSTAHPERWFTYEAAVRALERNPQHFAGIGYVMTGPHGLVGTDLDDCIKDGRIEPWAQEIVDDLASYTEVSPSGRGLRIFNTGEIPSDWNNHERGIEVYGGNDARFLTITGNVLPGCTTEVQPDLAGALDILESRYARAKTKATVIDLNIPDLVDELPDLQALEIPYQARDFLTSGEHRGDRSRELFTAAVSLYGVGLSDAQVFSLLVASPHAMEVALDHRRQDADRALAYLWREHCLKARSRAAPQIAGADDFDDVSEPGKAEVLIPPDVPASKAQRFMFQQAAEYLNRKPVTWLIKGVLPQADVGAVFGESGAGKSFFTLDLVMAVARGEPWRGHASAQGAVAYIVAEGAGGFTNRLRAYGDHHGVSLAEVPLHVLGDAPNFLEKKDIADLLAAVRKLGPLQVIVVDTLAQVTAGGNENSGEDMGRALAHCKVLSRATGALVLLVAHSGKDAARGLRGWSGIRGALDVEILVDRSDKHRAATVTKMKDGEGEGEEFGFTLESVSVGTDEEGDAITSCVVQHGAAVPRNQRKAEPKGKWQQLVIRTAQDMVDLAGDTVTTTELIDAAVNQMPAEDGKKDRRRERVLEAVESLVAANRLSVAGGVVNVL